MEPASGSTPAEESEAVVETAAGECGAEVAHAVVGTFTDDGWI